MCYQGEVECYRCLGMMVVYMLVRGTARLFFRLASMLDPGVGHVGWCLACLVRSLRRETRTTTNAGNVD